MKTTTKTSIALGLVALILMLVVWWSGGLGNLASSGKSQLAAAVAANLLTTDSFAVLAGAGITNTGPTTISGDVGTFPTPTENGFGSVTFASGANHADDATTEGAKTDLVTAYNALASQVTDGTISADLGGQTLAPGVYTSGSSIGLTGTVTLDGGGDPNAVFVFQAGSTLTTASASSVSLINGTQACNVFWQVGSSATLGTSSTFRGTLIALTSITVTTGVTVNGRVLARNGAVTLDTNTITKPTCVAPTLATLHVVKSVINVGSSAAASDFTVSVKTTGGTNVSGSPASGAALPGTSYSLVAGTYLVTESAHAGYTQTFGADCPGGSVTLASGEDKTCTVINTDNSSASVPGVTPSTSVTMVVPLIGIVKVPSPLALPGGSGPVTYNYTVTNVAGQKALVDVNVADDTCSPVTLLSGDINNDHKLDPSEKWRYSCADTLSTTTTNTAVATGYSDDAYHTLALATALATVVVGAPIAPPLIDIIKVPSRLTPFPFGGGAVTYTYTVTNPGVVAMHDVTVTDDKCTPVSFISGDTNKNQLLEPSETWTYTCQTRISVSTRNVATALGKANGLIALDYAFATVLVSVPGLPDTGLLGENDTALPSSVTNSQTAFHLTIPEIGVDAAVETVGLTPDGVVDVPASPTNAGWFAFGPSPGQIGTAVIDGHSGWKNGVPAVFNDLHALQKGDKIYLTDATGAATSFVVRALKTYGKDEAVPDVFNSNDGKKHLNLITCAGAWDATTKTSSDRLVVFTDKE